MPGDVSLDLLVVGTGNPDGERTARWYAALEGDRHRGGLEAVGAVQVEVVCVTRVMSQRPPDLDGRLIGCLLVMGDTGDTNEVDVPTSISLLLAVLPP